MCLILLALNPNDRFRLVVAANRDEYYARPTRAAAFWPRDPSLLAGMDEKMGGSWLGVSRTGRFAAVTNFREEPRNPAPPRSRGDLPRVFLQSEATPGNYVDAVSNQGDEYRGFNLIAADREACYYHGNRNGRPRRLDDGCYGLSNQLLDCDWPKVIAGRQRLRALLEDNGAEDLAGELFRMLLHKGDGSEFSNSFIASDTYGTRAATVVLIERDGGLYFEERNFGKYGEPMATNRFTFNCNDDS